MTTSPNDQFPTPGSERTMPPAPQSAPPFPEPWHQVDLAAAEAYYRRHSGNNDRILTCHLCQFDTRTKADGFVAIPDPMRRKLGYPAIPLCAEHYANLILVMFHPPQGRRGDKGRKPNLIGY